MQDLSQAEKEGIKRFLRSVIPIELAECMDKAIQGPRLFCTHCGKSKVFRKCYCCQINPGSFSLEDDYYCRFCGLFYDECKKNHN